MRKIGFVLFFSCLVFLGLVEARNSYNDLIHKEVNLYAVPEGSTIYVAVDKSSFRELLLTGWQKEDVAKDKKLLSLVMQGKVFEVKDNTKAVVLAIDYEMGKAKVRIVNGNRKGSKGWILVEYLQGN